ncbi:EF-hand calcium-binding domain-containing protein 5 [Rhizoclosmatium hyalinum]|nr:EF-hand calcium-binding domain-containing protein 5 [Rhizoclosmatium hyalinum]
MLENIIPTMMMALEKLLREVDVRGMANSDDFIDAINETNEEASGSQDDLKSTAITKDDDTTQCSKDRLEIQIDKPTKIPFNPINWIAQYLYRNNPRYVDPTDISNVPYFQQLRTVSQQTKARLFEFQLTQRATLRAEAMARKREKERLKKARTQQMEEMRLLFEQLLSTVFKKWTGKLWRIVNGSITKNEMLDAYKAILQSNSIQANDNMINKVGDLLTYLSMSPEVAESLRIVQNQQQAPGLTAGDETADKTSNVDLRATVKSRSKPTSASGASAGNETAGTPQSTNDDDASKETSPNVINEGTGVAQDDSGSNATPTIAEVQPKLFCLSPEYLSTDKWDQQTYVEATMILTDAGKWTIDDLSTFLLSLAAHIDTLGDKLISRFNSIYFAPKFSRTPGAVTFAPKDEWRHKLAKVVQEFDGKVPGGDSLKSSLIDYCRGNVTLAQLGVPQNLLNDVNGSEQTSLTIHPSTPEKEALWLKGCAEAEDEYKKFMMVMCGLYGVEPCREFFEYLQKKSKEDADLAEKEKQELKQKEEVEALKVSAEEMAARIMKMQSLFLLMGDGKGLTADTLNTSIDKVVTQMGNKMTSLVGGILSNLKYKGTKRENEKIAISPDNFTDRLIDHLQINNNEFSDLFKVLEIVFDSLSGAVNETQIAKVIETTVLTHNINRAEIQDQALKDVIALSRRDDMAIAEFSESALHILSRAIEQMHPEHRISGRVSLAESNVSKIQDSDNGEGEMLVERFLRIVACTNDCKRDLLGEVYGTGEQGFEAKTMALAKPFQSNDAHEDPVHAVKLNDDRVAKYVGLPLIASSKKPVGVIGMTLVGKEDGGYVPPDVEFLQVWLVD